MIPKIGLRKDDVTREYYETSPSQEHLWVVDRLLPGTPINNVPFLLRLRGRLDVPALAEAFTAMLERHDGLRCRIVPHQTLQMAGDAGSGVVDDAPRMILSDAPLPVLEVRDLEVAGLSEAAVRRMALAEGVIPFRTESESLVRAVLYRLDEQRYFLLVVVHHGVMDGVSSNQLFGEFGLAYAQRAAGRPIALPTPAGSFLATAGRQRGDAAAPWYDEQRRWWQSQLAGAPQAFLLPTDQPAERSRSFRSDALELVLPAPRVASLRRLAQRVGCSLFTILLAGFHLTLARWSGQEDFLLGVPVAGRRAAERQGVVGVFINIMPVRIRVSADQTVEEFLRQVAASLSGAADHQDMGFHDIVAATLDRGAAGAPSLLPPLVQALVNYRSFDETMFGESGLEVAFERMFTGYAVHPLALTLEKNGDCLHGRLTYRRDLFDAATIERLAGQFRLFLDGLGTLAETLRIANLPRLSAEERQRLLVEWNATDVPLPAGETVTSLFSRQARQRPTALAICQRVLSPTGESSERTERLTYGALESRVNRLAHRLGQAGIGPGSLVGIALRRGPDLVVSLLAVLKSGAAYLPLDLIQPKARLALVLSDTVPQLCLVDGAGEAILPDGLPRLRLDDPAERRRLERLPATPPHLSRQPDDADLAYILHTSGSTGRPKGVAVTRIGLLNLLLAMQNHLKLDGTDAVLALTTVGFDIAALELLLPVLTGARMVLLGDDQRGDPQAIGRVMSDEAVTVVQATPTLWRMLLDAVPRPLDRCRLLLSGGEALPADLAERLRRSGGRLINLYGPTETTIWSSLCEVGVTEPLPPGGVVAIGRPIANTRFYILDDYGSPVPVGVIGELYIGGIGVARGYVNRPELTAERFIADPFGASGERIYRTGDLARWRNDGVVEYLGRADGQVKLRGFRIETGEIESVLCEHPAVAQAAVVLRQDDTASAEPYLAAYLVARTGHSLPAAAELRNLLIARLPEYMVPSVTMELPTMPLNANGKLDRKALPQPVRQVAAAAWQAPREGEEQRLAALFGEVLGVEGVGADDDFFSLGGHSLLAVRLLARLRAGHDVDLPLHRLFAAPTVRGLAAAWRQTAGPAAGSVEDKAGLLPLRTSGRRPPLFCLPPGGGAALAYRPLAVMLGDDQPVYGLQAPGLEPGESAEISVADSAERALRLLRSVAPEGPYHLLGWSFGGLVAHELACRLQGGGHQVALLALLDSRPPQPVHLVHDEAALDRRCRQRFAREVLRLDDVAEMAAEEDLAGLLRRAQAAGAVPAEFTLELAQRHYAVFANATRQASRHRPGRFHGQVTFFRAAAEENGGADAEAWRPFVEGAVESIAVPAAHRDMVGPAALPVLVGRLQQAR